MGIREDPLLVAIVDDEAALRAALERLIRSAGFAAETFASAEEFLRSHHRHSAGCAILDVRLPGMSGLELQRHLAVTSCPVPTIVMTAFEDADGRMQTQALRAGATAFLHKPFTNIELFEAIAIAIARERRR